MSMLTDETTVFATGQVRSVQTLAVPGVRFVPDRHQVQEAGFAYFAFLDRLARPLLRVRFGERGTAAVRLCGITLLSFRPPEVREAPGMASIRFPIAAGVLVQRPMRGRGELRFEMHADRLVMAVEGYYAALAGAGGSDVRHWIYERTQAAIHRRVAARYLDLWLGRLIAARSIKS
ncbi:hypothetical protein [Symbiobacterium thermophilum]|jgi:hypothetical protein|nr:hypothetical protein [Symbiobacterium thermophilum]